MQPERRSLPEPADAVQPAPGTPRFLTGRREWLAVGLLLLAALLLRVVFVLGMRASPAFDAPSMDVEYHVQWARAFARGEDFQPGPFFRAPLYVWFLGTVFKLFGDGLLLPRLLQSGLGCAGTLLVYLLGRALFDRRVGWWAAVGAATYWVSIYFDGELLIPTLAIPLNLLGLWLAVRYAQGGATRTALGAGVAFGLSAIARPNVLLFLPFLAFWFLRSTRLSGPGRARLSGPGIARLSGAVALALGAALPVLPITAYNALVGGDRVLISSQAGVNLWIGNHPGADGSAAIAPGTRADWWGGYRDTIAQAEAAEGRPLAPSEVSRHYSRRARDFVFGDPGRSIPLLLRKLRLFWMDWELGNNQEIRFFAFRFNPWLRYTPLRFAFVAAAGILGIALTWRRRAELFPLWGFLLVYMLSVVAFFINGRYRLPVVPILLIYASHALLWAFDRFRDRRYPAFALALGALTLGVLASRSTVPGLATDDANGLWQLAVAHELRGDLAGAEAALEEALAVRPSHPFARVALGRILARQGRTPEAIRELELAARGPAGVNALEPLLDLYIEAGRLDQALAYATASLARHADLAAVHYAIGRVHAARGAWAEAHSALTEAERLDRGDARYPFGVALAEQFSGREDAALASLERAVQALERQPERSSPEFAERVFETLLELLRGRGDAAPVRDLEQRRQAWRARVSGSTRVGR